MNKKNKVRNKHIGIIKYLLLIFIIISFVSGGFFMLWVSTIKLPDFNSLEKRSIAESTKIYDRTGDVLLYDSYGEKKRTTVKFSEISRFIKNATVAIEDDEFYTHIGIKPMSFMRALFVNIGSGSFKQGGSTITQQVVKNVLLTPDKKIARKLKEWILAIKLERALSKEDILTLYLNETPYGGTIYGIEEASSVFFGKNSKDLTLAESAYLASLPQAPTRYSPYGNNTDKLVERKNLVLSRMLSLNFINEEEYDSAMLEEVHFLPRDKYGIKAPHFVIWIMDYLAEKYGEKIVRERGLRVITTLDYNLQKISEEAVTKFGDINEIKFKANNAAVVGIDPKTGQILTMVGSRDYFNTKNSGNFNVALSHRQPGSAFKPFVYATAFDKGYTPETVVFDLKTEFQTTCNSDGKPISSKTNPSECYMPVNYDGIYRGPVSFRDALAQSINVPAIKVLYLAGISDSIQTAKNMGINGLGDKNSYGLTLALGGGEVSLLDLTSAYGVFANKGIKNKPVGILKIQTSKGEILEEFRGSPVAVLNEKTSNRISSILSDNKARTPAFGANSPLYFEGQDVAVKTGTTNDYRDAWTIGYTPSFSLGVWVGNNDNSSMEKKVAGFIVTPMWNEIMKKSFNYFPIEKFDEVDIETSTEIKPILRGIWKGGVQYFTDKISGKLATAYTPKELLVENILTDVHSILYWVDKQNPNGSIPEKPENDPQFFLWEEPIKKWIIEKSIKKQNIDEIPIEYDNIHSPLLSPKISIVQPENNSIFSRNDTILIKIIKKNNKTIKNIDYFINNVFVGSSNTSPYSFSIQINNISNIKNINEIRAVVYDNILNSSDATIMFTVEDSV